MSIPSGPRPSTPITLPLSVSRTNSKADLNKMTDSLLPKTDEKVSSTFSVFRGRLTDSIYKMTWGSVSFATDFVKQRTPKMPTITLPIISSTSSAGSATTSLDKNKMEVLEKEVKDIKSILDGVKKTADNANAGFIWVDSRVVNHELRLTGLENGSSRGCKKNHSQNSSRLSVGDTGKNNSSHMSSSHSSRENLELSQIYSSTTGNEISILKTPSEENIFDSLNKVNSQNSMSRVDLSSSPSNSYKGTPHSPEAREFGNFTTEV